jgi:hypothetical protein
VVIPPRDVQLRFGRGYSYIGTDVSKLWQQQGVEVEVWEGLDLKTMSLMLRSDIVHLAGSFEEARGEVRLLAGWEPVTSTAFARSLKGNPSTSARPFLVLDTPRPDSPNEAYRQLVLRNSLADELFRQQCVSGVLACGLGEESELQTVTPEFIAQLATGKMVDAANIWWSRPTASDFPAALFTSNPDLPAWHGGNPWNSPHTAG